MPLNMGGMKAKPMAGGGEATSVEDAGLHINQWDPSQTELSIAIKPSHHGQAGKVHVDP